MTLVPLPPRRYGYGPTGDATLAQAAKFYDTCGWGVHPRLIITPRGNIMCPECYKDF